MCAQKNRQCFGWLITRQPKLAEIYVGAEMRRRTGEGTLEQSLSASGERFCLARTTPRRFRASASLGNAANTELRSSSACDNRFSPIAAIACASRSRLTSPCAVWACRIGTAATSNTITTTARSFPIEFLCKALDTFVLTFRHVR